jgi:molecular chaperone DnaK (HSP70)
VTLASLVLRHMLECAAKQFGRTVTDVIVAAPAEYTSAQLTTLLRACERAGLRVKRFVPEPNAAALLAAQWLEARPDLLDKTALAPSATVLIIDIGGGTTDVSALEVAWVDGEWQFEVLSTRGDNELGGMDYDEALQRHLRDALLGGPGGGELVWTPSDDARLLDQARQAKERLALAQTASIILPDLQTRGGELRSLQVELDRPTAIRAVELVDARLHQKVEAAAAELEHELDMWKQRGEHKYLAGVLLAGQGSKLWTVADYLRRRFADTTIETGFQESAVCRGLVLQSAVMRGQRPDMLLLDVTTFTIGMRYLRQIESLQKTPSYRVDPVPERNTHVLELIRFDTTLPTRYSQSFSTNGPGELAFEVVELNRAGELVGLLGTLRLPLVHGQRNLTVDVDIGVDRRTRFRLLDEPSKHPLASAELRLSSE